MEDLKWLKRKYPDSFDNLNEYFNRKELRNFKRSNLKIGVLNKDILFINKYPKGSVFQFRRSNPVNDYNHPFIYCVFKCALGFTESGYHSFDIIDECFDEIKK